MRDKNAHRTENTSMAINVLTSFSRMIKITCTSEKNAHISSPLDPSSTTSRMRPGKDGSPHSIPDIADAARIKKA